MTKSVAASLLDRDVPVGGDAMSEPLDLKAIADEYEAACNPLDELDLPEKLARVAHHVPALLSVVEALAEAGETARDVLRVVAHPGNWDVDQWVGAWDLRAIAMKAFEEEQVALRQVGRDGETPEERETRVHFETGYKSEDSR